MDFYKSFTLANGAFIKCKVIMGTGSTSVYLCEYRPLNIKRCIKRFTVYIDFSKLEGEYTDYAYGQGGLNPYMPDELKGEIIDKLLNYKDVT